MRLARAYVLAKDEEANIGRCVAALVGLGLPCTVLDSGSSDRTPELARAAGADVTPFRYEGHCSAYNELTARHGPDEALLVLDADMVVGSPLLEEVVRGLEAGAEVVRAPIEMYWEGQPLRHASLCPPKPIAFRGGSAYFEPCGHGEQLRPGLRVHATTAVLLHDDRKPFERMLLNQVRYARDLVGRPGSRTWRDWVRLRAPAMVVAVPLYTWLVRGGFRDGRAGLTYALDRLIAEAIFYRTSVASRLRKP